MFKLHAYVPKYYNKLPSNCSLETLDSFAKYYELKKLSNKKSYVVVNSPNIIEFFIHGSYSPAQIKTNINNDICCLTIWGFVEFYKNNTILKNKLLNEIILANNTNNIEETDDILINLTINVITPFTNLAFRNISTNFNIQMLNDFAYSYHSNIVHEELVFIKLRKMLKDETKNQNDEKNIITKYGVITSNEFIYIDYPTNGSYLSDLLSTLQNDDDTSAI